MELPAPHTCTTLPTRTAHHTPLTLRTLPSPPPFWPFRLPAYTGFAHHTSTTLFVGRVHFPPAGWRARRDACGLFFCGVCNAAFCGSCSALTNEQRRAREKALLFLAHWLPAGGTWTAHPLFSHAPSTTAALLSRLHGSGCCARIHGGSPTPHHHCRPPPHRALRAAPPKTLPAYRMACKPR